MNQGLPTSHGSRPTGLERLLDEPSLLGKTGRVGLLSHPAGVTRDLAPSAVALLQKGIRLERLFGPEHGVDGSGQAGEAPEMAADPLTGLPAHSLYEKTPDELAALVARVDTLLVDLQDVGLRYYTYVSTLVQVLGAARQKGVRVVVLDRPNPLGFAVSGPVLQPAYRSFVGMLELPLRHGLTLGECARFVDPDVEVIPCDPQAVFGPEALPWVPPSPNLPNLESVWLYTGVALVEASTASEGRGTALPFGLVGAPGLDAARLARQLNQLGLPGVRFRPVFFTPYFSKHQGQRCAGVQVHRIGPPTDLLAAGLALLGALAEQGVQINPDWLQKLLGIPFTPDLLEPTQALAHTHRWTAAARAYAQAQLQTCWLYPRPNLAA